MPDSKHRYTQITHAIKRDCLLVGAITGGFALWNMVLADLINGLVIALAFVLFQTLNTLLMNWRLHAAYRAELARRHAQKEAELAAAFAQDEQTPNGPPRRKSFSLDD
jgi:hypothetical protein